MHSAETAMSVSLPAPRARHPGDASRDVRRPLAIVAFVAAAVAWVPMLLLAFAESVRRGRPEAMTLFASDFTSHVRFLVAVPLLIVAEQLVSAAFARCEGHILSPGFVDVRDKQRLREGIDTARRLRESPYASTVLALLALGVSLGVRSKDASSWGYFEMHGRGATWSSTWLGVVGFPIFRFVLLRGMYRWLVWTGFLFWLRRFDLRLIATHPDRCGGLGFLSVPISASLGVVFGVSATGAMAWRRAVLSHAATFAHVRAQALLFGAVWLVLLLAPLIFFTPRLLRLKRVALIEYAELGDEYTRAFQAKWLRQRGREEEPLLGTADIQSLADLGTAMEVVQNLRPAPFDLHVVFSILIVYAVALLPVILSQLSLEQLLVRLVQAVL